MYWAMYMAASEAVYGSDGPTEIGDVEEMEEEYVFSPDPELLKFLKGGGK